MANTDDCDDYVFEFYRVWTDAVDENDLFKLQILIDKENEKLAFIDYTFRLMIKGDLHMIWPMVGCLQDQYFMIVYFKLKGDENNAHHYHIINGKKVWLYFRNDIGYKKWLMATKYTDELFQNKIIRTSTTSKVGRILTPKSRLYFRAIIHLKMLSYSQNNAFVDRYITDGPILSLKCEAKLDHEKL